MGSWQAWSDQSHSNIVQLKSLEEQNNRLFIGAYGLEDELSQMF